MLHAIQITVLAYTYKKEKNYTITHPTTRTPSFLGISNSKLYLDEILIFAFAPKSWASVAATTSKTEGPRPSPLTLPHGLDKDVNTEGEKE